jgi:hypothetical protein
MSTTPAAAPSPSTTRRKKPERDIDGIDEAISTYSKPLSVPGGFTSTSDNQTLGD